MTDGTPEGQVAVEDIQALPDAALRRAADRFMLIVLGTIEFLLVAWLAVGFMREPPASTGERIFVVILVVGVAGVLVMLMLHRRRLPALDWTPRQATVSGTVTFTPDAESHMPVHHLVTVTVDIDGETLQAAIADIVHESCLDRFAPGTTWSVYAFKDPHVFDHDHGSRVILTESHDDVVRAGYDLGSLTMHNDSGPGSDLLQRGFKPS
ncbi:hypothetical protein LX16_5074 [Stackebrandtia albiflava]|uniref:Uncharacterized protein n=1 Tax=Stackebrandtia albiflava TaxID=406432 RepID=A0A562UPQ1_9ACTN|nr:hypothetical protein LX16_5074 [Stackebrandtia albiflava]